MIRTQVFTNIKRIGMYWLYLIIFIIAVMIPDIFREDYFGIPHEQIEELAIFILGLLGFLFFILKEHQLVVQEKEKKREQRRLQQTARDLIESYSYIGEINRKMDLLMQIGMGLSERTNLTEKRENEIYQSITESASFLLKAECASLFFFDTRTNKAIKHVCRNEKCGSLGQDADLFLMGDNIFIKQSGNHIVFRSHETIDDVKSYLVIKAFDEFQGRDNNNQEIIKYLASQALILYSYIAKNPISRIS
ncbi:MAG: hypothetical protein Q8L11_00970 [Candidatus Moranbacteria bacterium]|nr:hypothetical protein [Candidatus Moranbacteria bacterium]